MMNLTSENRKKKQEKVLERQKDNTNWNNLNKRVTVVGPTWKTKHEITVKELEVSLTKFCHQQIGNLLKLEKIDKNTIELYTKVDTMFTPMIDTYEYQDILARLKDLEKVDEATALHCSRERIHNLSVYKHDFQIMTDKLRTKTTIAHESR